MPNLVALARTTWALIGGRSPRPLHGTYLTTPLPTHVTTAKCCRSASND